MSLLASKRLPPLYFRNTSLRMRGGNSFQLTEVEICEMVAVDFIQATRPTTYNWLRRELYMAKFETLTLVTIFYAKMVRSCGC